MGELGTTRRNLTAAAKRSYRLADLPAHIQGGVRAACRETCRREAPRAVPCVESGHACARCQEHARLLTQPKD